MKRHIQEIRQANEPTRTALAMARAIQRHVKDILEDDPGDRDDTAAWQEVEHNAKALRLSLERMTRKP